ncbi:ribosomal RNA-processing protein 7 homolog A-like [Artemia franciscana]|uniref:RRM domain-containing protein n=1 Tax=Artemia franciscana TaxID=6661 RepID=A0AA88KWZ6_ARTSF|nr:hypothetical protein QYM36_011927 [Artemia franciscana]
MLESKLEMNKTKSLEVQIDHHHKATHSLFLQEYTAGEDSKEKPAKRTLFVMNVPPYCNKECLECLFREFGKIMRIYIQSSPTSKVKKESSHFFPDEQPKQGFKFAYIVYQKLSHVKAALNADNKQRFFVDKEKNYFTGIKKWIQQCEDKLVSRDELQREINTYLEEYDKQKAIQEAKNKQGEADDEGWTVVTSKGRAAVIARTEATEQKIKKKEKKKMSEKQLVNFYTYQLKQSKIQNVAQLRQKFEEDKKRIQELKSSRKFRPY